MGTKQFTTKLLGVWRILWADHVLLFTVKNQKSDGLGVGGGTLGEIMSLAIEMKKAYNGMIEMVNREAVESGELHALTELRKTLENLEDK
jgi:hypothetical protein